MSIKDQTKVALKPAALPSETLGDDGRQWVHICPNGTIQTRDSRGPFILKNPDSVIEASRANSGASKMLVDYDHQSITARKHGKSAIAAGWIVGMQTRPNGIWALVEWTDKAANHIRQKEFRYISPVLVLGPDNIIDSIENVALTNSPALHKLTALASKEYSTMANENEVEEMQSFMKQLRTILGLDENANSASMIETLNDLLKNKQATSVDPTKYVTIGQFEEAVKEANSLRQGIQRSQAETYVENQIELGRIAPAFREWGIELCTRDKPSFDAFLKRTGPAFEPLFKQLLPNAFPEGGLANSSNGLSSDEQLVCERMGLTPEQFKNAR